MKLPDNFKIEVRDKEEAAEIQELLFSLDYEWNGAKKNKIPLLDGCYVYVAKNSMTWQGRGYRAEWGENTPITLERLREAAKSSNKYYTDFSPEVWELAKKWAAGKLEIEDRGINFIVCYDNTLRASGMDKNTVEGFGWVKLNNLDFLSYIHGLPQKVRKFDKLPWPVEIDGEIVRMADKEFSFSCLLLTINLIDDANMNAYLGNFGNAWVLSPKRRGIEVYHEGHLISWEIWDEFAEWVKKEK